jgi:hypothetical protein
VTDFPPEWSILEITEYRIIKATLDAMDGNLSHTAEALKLSFRCMQYKVRRYQKLGLAIRWQRRNDAINTHLNDSATKAPELG